MNAHSGYEATARLSDDDLADLIRVGAAEERVWAAWAIGMRLAAPAASPVERAVQDEPTPGVRRHFVVVLAGLGRRDVIRALAESDPSAAVRATAFQYLARLTGPAEGAAAAFLLDRLRNEPSVDARLRLLENVRCDLSAAFRPAIVSLLSSECLELRVAAAECLLRCMPIDSPLPLEIVARITAETDVALREVLLQAWCERDGPGPMVSAARSYPVELALVALDLAIQRVSSFPWEAVEGLTRRCDRRLDLRVAKLLGEDLAPKAREWLLEIILANVQDDGVWHSGRRALWEAAQEAVDRLGAPTRPTAVALTCAEQRLLVRIRNAIGEAERLRLQTFYDEGGEEDLVVCPRERELLTALEARGAVPDRTGGDHTPK